MEDLQTKKAHSLSSGFLHPMRANKRMSKLRKEGTLIGSSVQEQSHSVQTGEGKKPGKASWIWTRAASNSESEEDSEHGSDRSQRKLHRPNGAR